MCHSFLCSISTVVGFEPRSCPRPLYTMRRVLVFWDDSAGGGFAGVEGSVGYSLCRSHTEGPFSLRPMPRGRTGERWFLGKYTGICQYCTTTKTHPHRHLWRLTITSNLEYITDAEDPAAGLVSQVWPPVTAKPPAVYRRDTQVLLGKSLQCAIQKEWIRWGHLADIKNLSRTCHEEEV